MKNRSEQNRAEWFQGQLHSRGITSAAELSREASLTYTTAHSLWNGKMTKTASDCRVALFLDLVVSEWLWEDYTLSRPKEGSNRMQYLMKVARPKELEHELYAEATRRTREFEREINATLDDEKFIKIQQLMMQDISTEKVAANVLQAAGMSELESGKYPHSEKSARANGGSEHE